MAAALALLGGLAVQAGCATRATVVRLYEEGSRTPEQVAVVNNPQGITVTTIDNYRVSTDMRFGRGKAVPRIEIMPGKHKIKVSKATPKSVFYDAAYNAVRNYRLQEATLSFEAEAGKSYVLGEEVEMRPFYKWTPWIKEVGAP